jgi:hypothetical protein
VGRMFRASLRGGIRAAALVGIGLCLMVAACGQVSATPEEAGHAIAAVKAAVRSGAVQRTPTTGDMPLEVDRFPDAPGAVTGQVPLGGAPPPPTVGPRYITVSFAVAVAPLPDGSDILTFIEGWPSGTPPCGFDCPTYHVWGFSVAATGLVTELTQSGAVLPDLRA